MSPGASRSIRKMTTDIPNSVRMAMTSRWATYVFTAGAGRRLLVQPHFLHPPVVVEVVVRDQVLHLRPVGVIVDAPVQRGPRTLPLQLLLDLQHLGQPLLGIDLGRLLVEHGRDLLVAVEGVVARRAAREVLVVVRVGIIDADAREVGADLVVAAGG